MPDNRIKDGLEELMSFIFGNHLLKIGSTIYNNENIPIQFIAQNPWGNNIVGKCSTVCLPPIAMNNSNDWFSIEQKINLLINEFMSKRESYSLSDCIWKLWIGRDQSLGTNLPILASGLESMIDSYISENKLVKKYNKKDKKEYKELISKELESLSKKLKSYQFGNFVINKLNNPFNLGIGEKMKIFFEKIEFDLSNSIENEALQARNKMAHNSFNEIETEQILEIKRLSNAYLTLVHRVILKLLGYEDGYVDYYTKGHPTVKISENISKGSNSESS